MRLTNLVEGRLLRRYKRFLADVELADKSQVTVHCPNPGSMLGVCEPGSRIFMARAREGRKLPYSWQFIETPGSMVMVDTMLANRLFGEAFAAGRLDELAAYGDIKPEYKYKDSRFDFYLTGDHGKALLEVKSTTLLFGKNFRCKADFESQVPHPGLLSEKPPAGPLCQSIAYFPDARTERGLKHLHTLQEALASGEFRETIQYYIVSRQDADSFRPCDAIDPVYAEALRAAHAANVRVLARSLAFEIEQESGGDYTVIVELSAKVPVDLSYPEN